MDDKLKTDLQALGRLIFVDIVWRIIRTVVALVTWPIRKAVKWFFGSFAVFTVKKNLGKNWMLLLIGEPQTRFYIPTIYVKESDFASTHTYSIRFGFLTFQIMFDHVTRVSAVTGPATVTLGKVQTPNGVFRVAKKVSVPVDSRATPAAQVAAVKAVQKKMSAPKKVVKPAKVVKAAEVLTDSELAAKKAKKAEQNRKFREKQKALKATQG